MRFSELAGADVVAEIAFLGIALLFLWFGWPRAALTAGLVARFSAHAASVLMVAGKRGLPLGLPRYSAAREMARFSTGAFGGAAIYAVSFNADFLLIGRLLGSTALGFYAMAWDLLRFVPDRVFKVAGRVTLPAFCHLQDQPKELARAFLNFSNYLSRIVLPIVICGAIAAPQLIATIYGRQWIPSAMPMQILSAGLVLVGLRIGIGSVYYAKNHPEYDIYLHTFRLVLIVIAVVALSSTGLLGISAGMSVVEALISVLGLSLACKLVGVGLPEFLEASMPGITLAAICAVVTFAGKFVAESAGIQGPLSLVIIAAPPALVYCWRESSVALQMFADAFGAGTATPAQVLEEPR
jgi:PST family polysaccharide transporter